MPTSHPKYTSQLDMPTSHPKYTSQLDMPTSHPKYTSQLDTFRHHILKGIRHNLTKCKSRPDIMHVTTGLNVRHDWNRCTS
ncbi:hypothetical protein BgiBS90_003160 [Biomphalaria glabrata]|nr:hypothetical protein BgiBS90_003160 [Biomphalaria glabrata]